MSDLRKLCVCMCVCVWMRACQRVSPPYGKLLSKRGRRQTERTSELEPENERSVVVSELASVVAVAAERRWTDFTHTHVSSPCHTRTASYLHTHTHAHLSTLALSQAESKVELTLDLFHHHLPRSFTHTHLLSLSHSGDSKLQTLLSHTQTLI